MKATHLIRKNHWSGFGSIGWGVCGVQGICVKSEDFAKVDCRRCSRTMKKFQAINLNSRLKL